MITGTSKFDKIQLCQNVKKIVEGLNFKSIWDIGLTVGIISSVHQRSQCEFLGEI